MRREKSTPTRRTLLSAIGTGFTAGLLGTGATATRSQSQYVLVQGDECVPIRPMRLQRPVETFYDYQLPREYVSEANGASVGDTARYASAGTMDLQRSQTSIVFLSQGPEGLSLVVVHGSVRDSDAGSVTFRISGLPDDGDWVVKDDLYRDPDTGELASSNYDRWQVEGTDHRIDWTWGSSGTDGGAFRDLGDDFEVVVDPAFNEAAALHDEHYEGTVTDWEFLSGSADVPDRISLNMDEPIRIATGSCERAGDADGRQREEGAGGERDDERQEQEDETEEREEDETEEQEEEEEETEEREQEEEDETEEQEEEREGEDGEQYTVCHKPPGNPDNARTIQVGSRSALESHLAHGDSRGPCSEDE